MKDWTREDDPYAQIAHLYEAEHGAWTDDLEMYTAFAQRAGGPVLDMGCGTGRVAVPMAIAGLDVHGYDASDALLAIAHGKVRDKGVTVELQRADLRRFSTANQYGLAICALDTFLHLETTQDQLDALGGAIDALRPGGLLVVDVLNPSYDRLAARDGVVRTQSTFDGPQSATVTHLVAWDINPADQTIVATHMYDVVNPDGAMHRRNAIMRMRYLHRFEMELLLRAAGFGRIELYGSATLDSYGAESDRMIFAASKPE